MHSGATTTLIRGRHRLGRPGLVHVATFVAVVRRGLFESWRVPGRHRRRRDVGAPAVPTPLPSPLPVVTPTAAPAPAAVPGIYAV